MAEQPNTPRLDIALDRSSPVPLYHQLAQAIEGAITSGQLNPGDRLENEVSLTSRLGLALPTARQAIQELVKKGLLVRKRGVGTQVVHQRINRDARVTSLYDDLVSHGNTPTTRVLSMAVGPLGKSVEGDLESGIDPTADFLHLRRLRSVDDTPLALMTNFLPSSYQLREEDLNQRGLYDCLRAIGVNPRIAHQTIGSRLMTEDEAKLLDEELPAAVLTVERTVYDDTGKLVEVGQHVYRASMYKVQTSLVS